MSLTGIVLHEKYQMSEIRYVYRKVLSLAWLYFVNTWMKDLYTNNECERTRNMSDMSAFIKNKYIFLVSFKNNQLLYT